MTCDEYLELLSARLDGVLTEAEERALEEHQAGCPDCRAAGAQLAALQPAFDELEDIPAPEGFAQGVMDRIHAEESKNVPPLFKRPQFRAIAGLAACAVLAVGLYGVVQQQTKGKNAIEESIMLRSFNKDALNEDAAACEVLNDPDTPMATTYSDLSMPVEEAGDHFQYEMQKTVPNSDVSYNSVTVIEPEHYAFQNDQYLSVAYGYTPEPGAQIIGSTQSLVDFLAQFSWIDFSEVQTQYSEAYFESGRLLAVVIEEPSGSISHNIAVQGLHRDEVEIVRIVPEAVTDDMAAWLILAEVDNTFHDGDELAVTVIPWEGNTDS